MACPTGRVCCTANPQTGRGGAFLNSPVAPVLAPHVFMIRMKSTDIFQSMYAFDTNEPTPAPTRSGPDRRIRILPGWELQGVTIDRPDLPILFGEGEELSVCAEQAHALISMNAAVAI